MKKEDARDPYVGMCKFIDQRAGGQFSSPLTVGKVISVMPLRVRADGLDLDGDDLKIAEYLLPGWKESVTATLPAANYSGTCTCAAGGGKCSVTRPGGEELQSVCHTKPAAVGEELLLLKSADGQTYYAVCELAEAPR